MLADNKLTGLPPGLFRLNLKTLDVSDNAFEQFPVGLDQCSTLVNFMIGKNKITILPPYLATVS